MTRNTAREIAVHLAYELSFASGTPEELLDGRLSKERFEELRGEDELYSEAPGPVQAEYIRTLVSGVEEVLDRVGFKRALEGADLVLTGEGKADSQTLSGKLPLGVLRRSGGVPVALAREGQVVVDLPLVVCGLYEA